MSSQFAAKGLPPPPLRIDKQRNVSKTSQPSSSRAWPTGTHVATMTSSSEPSRLVVPSHQANAPTEVHRTNSGRFRIRVPSLTRQQSRSSEAGPSNAPSTEQTKLPPSAGSQGPGKAWQPRWTPKLKRATPSESVTTYSPILDAPLPPLPPSAASPPPAVQLDDAGFGRPFSTSGLLDLNASRFSFLDMSSKDQDSDSDGEGSKPTSSSIVAMQLPSIREPPSSYNADAPSPLTASSSMNGRYAASAVQSSSLHGDVSHDTLRVPQSSSPLPGDASRSPQMSLPASSPALASLISSFPSPTTREGTSNGVASTSQPHSGASAHQAASHVRPAPAMVKENSWDGGERWETDMRKHSGLSGSDASTELPYLDMDDDETEMLEASFAKPSAAMMQPALSSSSTISQFKNRANRNPPPRPAPNMALPELPPTDIAQSQAAVRQHTPTSSVQLDRQPHSGAATSGRSSRQGQRPLILPTLRSSSSIDRLAAMHTSGGSSKSSPSDELAAEAKTLNGNNLKPLTLRRNASTDELAKSLDIPRETVKQMLDTTQHVWRNHLLGSAAALQSADAPSTHSSDRLSRSSSTPMLSNLFASQGSTDITVARGEDASKGSVARSHANRGSNRTSTLGLPYISSSRPSFEQQSPGWAMSKNSTEAPRPSTTESQAERARHRRTFLGRSSEDGPSASYNFSRPIRRDADGRDGDLGASTSMPALSAVREAPKPPALLQNPLLLKGESEATGFAQFVVDDEQEVLADSGSEAHQTFVLPLVPPNATANTIEAKNPVNMRKPVPALPQQGRTPSPRLVRRNSDTVLNRFAPEFGKRAPGELHAWSVCIDDDGVPAIRPSPSAFHRPSCPLAGKNNATWQCGCRGAMASDLKNVAPLSKAANLQVPGQSSPGHNRSMSASNVLDPVRQAELWSQVERNKELIRKHEQEIAGLQEQVVRISTEIASGRPSFSSAYATPDLSAVPLFPAPPTKVNGIARKPLPSIASLESNISAPPVPTKANGVEPFPSVSAAPAPAPAVQASASAPHQPPRTLRGRIASMSKMNLAGRDEEVRASQSLDLGHSRLRSSSSTSSLNKVFRFPWSRSSEKENVLPQLTPFPMGQKAHGKAASSSSSRDKALPNVQMYGADGSRPLPAPPLADSNSLNKDKRYPPSSRKYSYEMLHGPAFHTSVGSRHLSGRSGSSKSSSFGTSIFPSNESNEMHESSRFASFPKLGRRWDSISSRGTNVSARNSAEVAQTVGPSFESMPALSAVANKPMPFIPSDQESFSRHSSGDQARRPKTPPPRRSSLLRKSLEVAPPRRTPIPAEFLQANDAVMAPISEQSEMGSPASARLATIHADMEMSPASVVGVSPAGGPARMSMSERYRLQGLTVPAPLPLSSSHASSHASPALGSAAEPDSGIKVGETPKSPSSPRSARMALPVTFSHGALTVARRPSLKS